MCQISYKFGKNDKIAGTTGIIALLSLLEQRQCPFRQAPRQCGRIVEFIAVLCGSILGMKMTGVTIVRNAVLNNYPVVEAIQSVLPLVDEMIVSLDKGDDDSEALIRGIPSDKIKLHYSTWDMSLRQGGVVYAAETNKALDLVSADTDWILYIQADEVLHERDYDAIRAAAAGYLNQPKVQGLLFHYHHFYGTYDYVGDSRTWYLNEVRIIRNNPAIRSYKDAQGFRIGKTKLQVKPANAGIYHYGWVKSPEQMMQKQKNIIRYYHPDDDKVAAYLQAPDFFDFNNFDSIARFEGTHPAVMQPRIAARNWQVTLDVNQKKLSRKKQFLYWVEKKTGRRLFDFRNYRLLRGK